MSEDDVAIVLERAREKFPEARPRIISDIGLASRVSAQARSVPGATLIAPRSSSNSGAVFIHFLSTIRSFSCQHAMRSEHDSPAGAPSPYTMTVRIYERQPGKQDLRTRSPRVG